MPPRPWAAPLSSSAPLLTRVTSTIPQAHHPVGAAQGRGSAQGRSTRSSASPSCKPLSPTPPATNYTSTPAPPVHPAKALRRRPWAESIPPTWRQPPLKRPCVTGQCALLTPDQTLRRALYRASPRCSARRCKSAQWLVWLKAQELQLPAGGRDYSLAQDPSRMTQGRNITDVPRLAWCRLLLWPGEFG